MGPPLALGPPPTFDKSLVPNQNDSTSPTASSSCPGASISATSLSNDVDLSPELWTERTNGGGAVPCRFLLQLTLQTFLVLLAAPAFDPKLLADDVVEKEELIEGWLGAGGKEYFSVKVSEQMPLLSSKRPGFCAMGSCRANA